MSDTYGELGATLGVTHRIGDDFAGQERSEVGEMGQFPTLE